MVCAIPLPRRYAPLSSHFWSPFRPGCHRCSRSRWFIVRPPRVMPYGPPATAASLLSRVARPRHHTKRLLGAATLAGLRVPAWRPGPHVRRNKPADTYRYSAATAMSSAARRRERAHEGGQGSDSRIGRDDDRTTRLCVGIPSPGIRVARYSSVIPPGRVSIDSGAPPSDRSLSPTCFVTTIVDVRLGTFLIPDRHVPPPLRSTPRTPPPESNDEPPPPWRGFRRVLGPTPPTGQACAHRHVGGGGGGCRVVSER
jgi:hypothetical protein